VTHVGPCILRGGAETWLQGLARFLDPARVRLERCLVTDPGLIDPQVSAEMGLPVEIGSRDAVRQASRDSDVLLCWGPPELADWLGDSRPRLAVFVAHGEGAWTRYVLGRCAPVLDHVVGVSRWVSERLSTPLPLTCIPNGVDAARLGPTRPRAATRAALGFSAEDFVLGFVGRFVEEKRPELLVEVVARLPPPFKALFVGWGALRARVMDLANERIPGRYAFATAVSDVGDYYAALDALCLTSTEEGHGLVVLEAMMSGRPVIGTPVGCVPEVIEDRVNGLVARDGADSFVAAALLLYRRPDWARGLAAEGRAFALEHGHARSMARRYEDLLLRLWREKQAI
jgi:glycosyltransferase involved in cell wall biosynthesis